MTNEQQQQLLILKKKLPDLERRVFAQDSAFVEDRDIVLYWLVKIALSVGERLEALEREAFENRGGQ